MAGVIIEIGPVSLELITLDTPTTQAIIDQLPFNATAQTWGEEVYFQAPVSCSLEPNARDIIEPGEIAFWTEGQCIAIGYGKTPVSVGNEIRLAAKTNIWARSQTDVKALSSVTSGDPVVVRLKE
jgi:hypothetical protein